MTRPLVLVAEDDPSVRLTLGFVLEDEGFDVVMAEDGKEATALIAAQPPDVVLLDQMMPKMDGKEVYRAMRADPATRDVPVLVLTGMHRPGTDEWPGAYFVGKPFSPDALIRRIREVLAP